MPMLKAVVECVDEYLEGGEVLALSVEGDCMYPSLKSGEQLNILRKEVYWPGDIVAYYCQYSNKYLIHRMLGPIPFRSCYFIKADNVHRPDIIVERQYILGSADVYVSFPKRLKAVIYNYYWVIFTLLGKLN